MLCLLASSFPVLRFYVPYIIKKRILKIVYASTGEKHLCLICNAVGVQIKISADVVSSDD